MCVCVCASTNVDECSRTVGSWRTLEDRVEALKCVKDTLLHTHTHRDSYRERDRGRERERERGEEGGWGRERKMVRGRQG